MAITYTLVPIPLWYFAQNNGLPLGGGYMKTFRSLDQITPKPVFSDPAGQSPYPNPVFFNANGEAPGPFFWASDEPYFIEIFDANNGLIFVMNNFGPAIAGGGGGGSVTSNVSLDNFIVNNNFAIHDTATYSGILSGQVIAPSNHHGLIKFAPSNVLVAQKIPFAGPDIMFLNNNPGSNDTLTFATADFNPGLIPLTGDVTPEFYIDLNCISGGNETLKCIQFPINLHVKNLEQTQLTLIIWAKSNSATPNLTANFVQYFGSDSSELPVVTPFPIGASPLSGSWNAYVGTITATPSVAGKVLGAGGDDANYLQICFPTASTFNISITKPKIYLGQVSAVFREQQTQDQIDRIVNSPRTGDVKLTYNTVESGWVAANDGTIGSASSGATCRANIDTWPLYALLYTSVLDHWAPVSGRTGTTTTTAAADFAANKPLTLTRALGRVLAGLNANTITPQNFTKTDYVSGPEHFTLTVTSSLLFPTGTPVLLSTSGGGALPVNLLINTVYYVINTGATTIKLASSVDNAYAGTALDVGGNATPTCTVQTALGAQIGESAHTQSINEMPAHHHVFPQQVQGQGAGAGFNSLTGSSGSITADTGGGQAFNIVQPTTLLNVFYKL